MEFWSTNSGNVRFIGCHSSTNLNTKFIVLKYVHGQF